MQVIFDFVPQRGMAKAFFDGLGDGKFRAVDAKAVGDVVEDGFGEWIRALEDHADAAAKLGNVLREDVLTVEKNFAFEAGMTHGFVHAVESAQERGLAASRWADKGGDFVGGDIEIDVEERLLGAVVEIDFVNVHAHRQGRGGFALR